jgi:putative endonuclease
MRSRQEIGSIGEKKARTYLEQQGYQIIEINYRNGRGEIDIIGVREHMLVFVEVKTKSSCFGKKSLQKVRWQQQQKIKNTAFRYLENYYWCGSVRFDVILVYLDNYEAINHYPGYFS